ncbi:MAG TPA: winged helix-turn-helix domain-containing protein [Polyangiaceae bacterium]|jgi:predicted ATPase/DNA-binding winged helix-turn-helix (wHTH) protein
MDTQTLTFGTFRLVPAQHALFDGNRLVRLGNRALDILITLVQRAGELVTKEELLSSVWADAAVEEGNLRVHVAALRKVLGDGQAGARYIGNVPGQGYRFMARVEYDRLPAASVAMPAPGAAQALPAPLVRMVGRDDTARAISEQLIQHRLVSIVAPGGMGKTTVATAVAEQFATSQEHGARFVDLATLAGAQVLPAALASVLSLPATHEARVAQIYEHLSDKRLLLVFDNCEHLVDAAATLVEGILKAAPGVRVLVTSREPLGAQGEWISRLPALKIPSSNDSLSAAAALEHSAVQLFVERAMASADSFELSDEDAPVVADICRRLDGNPLAIELAASRAAVFGVNDLASRLDAQFSLLMKGHRSALPRHRTLSATLDWSCETLSASEHIVLRRLAPFRASFSLESAVAIVTGGEIDDNCALDAVIGLTSKSLLMADASGDEVRYRLLEITREYAANKLSASGEAGALARRHAEHCRDLFDRAERQLQSQSPDKWFSRYWWRIDDVRAALTWAFGPDGDISVGVALTISSIPLWFRACLMDEYRAHLEMALARVRAEAPASPPRELRLSVALGHLLLHTIGPTEEVVALIERALTLSVGLDAHMRMHAVWAMWLLEIGRADYRAALRLAEQFGRLCASTSELPCSPLYDRMMALPLHFMGEHAAARVHAERVLRQPATELRLAYNTMSHVDQQVSMQILLARIFWMQGFPERALSIVQQCVARAFSLGHPTSICHALALGACPVALWSGEMALARDWIDTLVREATRHSLGYWRSWGRGLDWALDLVADPALGAEPRSMPADLTLGSFQLDMLATTHEVLASGETVKRAQRGDVGWCEPEVKRAQAMVILSSGAPGAAAEAEALLLDSLAVSRRQSALSWELRAALSLAGLWRTQGRMSDARELLSSLLDRFGEGFGTRDLLRARALLGELGE